MGVYGVSTYGVGVYGPDTTVITPPPPDGGGGGGTLPPPDTGPDSGPGPRPPVNGGDVIAGAIPKFSVAPFTLNQITYGQFYLSWGIPPHSSDPTADWRFLRLIRSATGVPVSYTDGTVLVDVDSWHSGAPNYRYDTDLTPGQFYYYSIWLGQSAGNNETEAQAVWYAVGNVVGLAVADYGWTQRLWDWIPRFYRYGSNEVTADSDDPNQPLYKFVDVLGFHLNMINTDITAAIDLYNPQRMQYGALERYGASVGAELEPTVTARLNRERIGNAAYDQLLRGTAQGLENVLSALTGWDVEIGQGKNLLLSGDQSGPDHPITREWVYEYVYQENEIVQYQGYQYSARLTHTGRIPPTGGGENDYWSPAVGWASTAFRSSAAPTPQATWNLAGASNSASLLVVSGLPNVLVADRSTDSGWEVRNDGAAATDADVMFPGGVDYVTPPGMNEVIKGAAPIPETLELTALSGSLHVYLPDGPTAAGARPYLAFYDELGGLLAHVAEPFWQPVYDSFTNITDIPISSSIADTGHVWSGTSNVFHTSGKYLYLNTQTPGSYYEYMNMLRPDLAAALTMSHVGSTRKNGLLLRYADPNNNIRISATDIQTTVGGITNTLATFVSPFVDGDRMQATVVGSTLTVLKNNGNTANGWSANYTVTALSSNNNFGIWTTVL